MIVKEWSGKVTTDIKLKAGQEAEKQMAFYLKREFSCDKDIFVFNDLRIIHDNEVAQIDHFILHKYGFILIESKSVTGSVEINEYGEWIRWFNKSPRGMGSPIIQLEMQQNILVRKLEANAPQLLGRLIGLQKHFGGRKFDRVVAISDQGRIVRKQKTEDVYKADMVASILRKKVKQYKSKVITGDSVWFNNNETQNIKHFLLKNNQSKKISPPQSRPIIKQTAPVNEVKEPKKTYASEKIKYHKPPFSCPKCRIAFDIRYNHNHYLYCQKCRGYKPLGPLCPKCNSEVKLKLVERITTYNCTKNSEHHGIFYKNEKLWLKDKNKLASETT